MAAATVQEGQGRSGVYCSYESERGYPPYDPRLMLKLLVYGYANGICSSRKLERATHRDVAIRMLCAGQHPDYRSIARFRARHLEALSELFVEALRLCAKAGLVSLGQLARSLSSSVRRLSFGFSELPPSSRAC